MPIDPQSVESLEALFLGFAFAGLLASAFELVLRRPIGFGLLQAGGWAALASVPVLVFSAPVIIVRNTIRGRRIERRPLVSVVVASVIAGFWSLLCGRLVLDAAQVVLGS